MLVYRLEITSFGPYSGWVPGDIRLSKTYQDFLYRHCNTKRYPGWYTDNIMKPNSNYNAACPTEKKLLSWFGKRLLNFLAKHHNNCSQVIVYDVPETFVITGTSKKQCACDKTNAQIVNIYSVKQFLQKMEKQ